VVEREQSEFNSAVSYLNRLNVLFAKADEASIELDPYGWFHTLMTIYRELSTEMKTEDFEFFEGMRGVIKPHLDVHLKQMSLGRGGVTTELYDHLHLFEMRLRRVMRESGLQQKIQEDIMKKL
jgi:hypothetical protein